MVQALDEQGTLRRPRVGVRELEVFAAGASAGERRRQSSCRLSNCDHPPEARSCIDSSAHLAARRLPPASPSATLRPAASRRPRTAACCCEPVAVAAQQAADDAKTARSCYRELPPDARPRELQAARHHHGDRRLPHAHAQRRRRRAAQDHRSLNAVLTQLDSLRRQERQASPRRPTAIRASPALQQPVPGRVRRRAARRVDVPHRRRNRSRSAPTATCTSKPTGTFENNEEQWRIFLSGEVRRESIQPDRTVTSDVDRQPDIDQGRRRPGPRRLRPRLVLEVVRQVQAVLTRWSLQLPNSRPAQPKRLKLMKLLRSHHPALLAARRRRCGGVGRLLRPHGAAQHLPREGAGRERAPRPRPGGRPRRHGRSERPGHDAGAGPGDGDHGRPRSRSCRSAAGGGLKELEKIKNVALVMVTARVPATGARRGDQLDCYVSGINGKSLAGGRLAFAALQGPEHATTAASTPCAKAPSIWKTPTQPLVGVVTGGCQMEEDIFTPVRPRRPHHAGPRRAPRQLPDGHRSRRVDPRALLPRGRRLRAGGQRLEHRRSDSRGVSRRPGRVRRRRARRRRSTRPSPKPAW